MQTDKTHVKWQKVYIFISSTFNDMHAERDYLVKKVFPQLGEWCEKRRLYIVDIDLRWGVTEADAAHNKNVVDVCLKRIDDCRPFFVCFLGQRRGWVPKENEISPNTLDSFPELESHIGKTSVTEMEIFHALIKPLHGNTDRDTAKPVEYYKPAKHAFFYLRDKSYLSEIPSEPPLLKQTYTNELITDVSDRKEADRELKEWREVKIPETARPVKIYKAKWNQERSTPEIAIPMQCPSDNPENIERWHNDWQRHAHVQVTGKDVEENLSEAEKAKQFNKELTKGRLSDFECEGEILEGRILNDLKTAIKTDPRFKDHKEVDYKDTLQNEIDQQEQFVFINSEGFIKREGDFKELDDYVESDSNKLFVLTAKAGMGKSTLLANWINNYRDKAVNNTDHSIHFRFIGASDGSNTVYSLLLLLLREIKEVSGKLEDEIKEIEENGVKRNEIIEAIPEDPIKMRNALPELLKKISLKGKTVIVIDALNQLETGLSDLAWLPRQLPNNIKLIGHGVKP